MAASEAELSGKLVAVAERVTKALRRAPDRARPVDLRVLRGDRLGIVGANGAGKTTLLNLLTGALAPDAGEVGLGTNLLSVTLDQQRASLDPARDPRRRADRRRRRQGHGRRRRAAT